MHFRRATHTTLVYIGQRLLAQVTNLYAGKLPRDIFISSLSIKNPVVSSCWHDYISRYLEFKSRSVFHMTTRIETSRPVGGHFSMNTSIPMVVRCDGRSYITADSRIYIETTTVHPPVTVTALETFPFWTAAPSCSALKMKDCREAYKAFASATSAAISSVYSEFWPSIPTLAANHSLTTIAIPNDAVQDGKGGLPPRISFSRGGFLDFFGTGGLSGAAGIYGMCKDAPPVLETCPSRPVVEKCQAVAYAMTVYYWPTSSVGDYCGAKTRMPATMTKPGEPNTALIINKGYRDSGFTTLVTSPSALVYIPWIHQQYETLTTFDTRTVPMWTSCGNDFTTSATFQIHPDDLSQVTTRQVLREIWTTDRKASTSGRATQYRRETTTVSADLAGVYNPAWLKQDWNDDPDNCRHIYNGDIHTTDIVTTITEPQVASMQQSNCTLRILTWKDAPALALPAAHLINALNPEWLNWGGKPNADGKPFCNIQPTRVMVNYIALDSATVTTMAQPLLSKGPAVVVTITTEPPWVSSEAAARKSLFSKLSAQKTQITAKPVAPLRNLDE
jgi:hypothetical protein